MGFSELLHTIGGMGNFQIFQTALLLFPAVLIACHSFLQNFTAMTLGHHCRPANWTNGSHVPGGVGEGDLLGAFIPLDKDQKPEPCLRFSEPHWQISNLNDTSALSLDTEACLDGWVYDRSVASSIVSEWDLVCEHKSLKSIAQSIYMTGQLVGAIAFGIFSDRCGRKTALQSGTLLMITMGTSAALAPSFPAYCVLRFLSGMAMTGIIITSLSMEWTPTHRRTLVNIYAMYMITLGQVVLSGLAYLIRQWRWLQGTVSVAYVIILLYSWYVSSQTHSVLGTLALSGLSSWEVFADLRTVARLNGRKEQGRKLTPEVCGRLPSVAERLERLLPLKRKANHGPPLEYEVNCWHLLSSRFSAGFSFYGLGLDVQKFGFNIYWTQVVFSVVDIPTKLLTGLSMGYFGRRITTVSLLLVAGCVILVTAFLPQDMNTFQMILCLLGKGSLAGCFTCLYLFTMELFPTEVRQIGMSAGIFSTRLGSLLSPLVYILGNHSPGLQPVMFGLVPLLAAAAASFLVETKNQPLLNTIQETEQR
uniref:Major facilitator superfamily (MFS) profile domain-containing protein n=1 Tax=Ursus americanus TaxID=9643 RepID=A0A452QAH7_URSAM